jgi:pimeloyl-ACP methyl ester carboxylesterase
MSAPPVRYVAGGDIHIAYQVVGDGPIDLVIVSGAITNLEVLWDLPEYRAFIEKLAAFARVILFDKRGMGLSDRVRIGPLALPRTRDRHGRRRVLRSFLAQGDSGRMASLRSEVVSNNASATSTRSRRSKSHERPGSKSRASLK